MGYSLKMFSVQQQPMVRESYVFLMVGVEQLSHTVTIFGSPLIFSIGDICLTAIN